MPFKEYFQAVYYLESLKQTTNTDYFTKRGSRFLFLQRFTYFLDLLGNPQNDLTFVHITGSSGKGSVATMIAEILMTAGHRTGLYTSPHCTTTIERIKVNKLFISPTEFTKTIATLKPKITYAAKHSPFGRPSYFEIMTAAAFLYFKQKKCDYVVLEVGLGGRFDATNIIKKAMATVINLIDLDHTDVLGNNLETIAAEKAAIIKPGTKVFTTATNKKSVIAIFKKVAKRKHVPLTMVAPPIYKYSLSVLGQHQQNNAALAAAVGAHLGATKKQITRGLKAVKLPCRFEIVQKNPQLIIDGAHNISKINSTAAALQNLTYKKLYLIIALTKERNPKQIFKRVIPLAEKIFVTQFKTTSRKKYSAVQLAKQLSTNRPIVVCPTAKDALAKALALTDDNDAVLVTGSLYLAGEVRNLLIPEVTILKKRHI